MKLIKLLINIDVPDLQAAIDFYRSALGLTLSRIIDGDVAEMTGAGTTIYLLQKPAGSVPAKAGPAARQYSRHWTPVHMDFVVDDVQAAAGRAIAAGAKQESACVEWMGSKCISFSDPHGHGFCLIEFAADTYTDQP